MLRDTPDPYSRESRETEPVLASSTAAEIFSRELERYIDGKVLGRSILVSGHRGSGKTTMVLNCLDQMRRARAGSADKRRPLLVHLNATDLFRNGSSKDKTDNEAAPTDRKDPPKNGPQPVPQTDSTDAPKDVSPQEHSDPSAHRGADETPSAPDSGGILSITHTEDPNVLVQRLLERIVAAIYRALSVETIRQFERYADKLARQGSGSPDLPEAIEQLKIELDDAPEAGRLRNYWEFAGALQHGFFMDHERTRPGSANQGFKEVVALATAAQAFRIVSGSYSEQETLKAGKALETKMLTGFSSASAGQSLANGAAAPLAGGLVGAGVAFGDVGIQIPLAVAAAVITSMVTAISLNYSTKRNRSQSIDKQTVFIRDRTVSTLERELPNLVRRIGEAGLQPVFVIDELDKLPTDSYELLDNVFSGIKRLIAENAFFCFLTDRDYFARVTRRSQTIPYPKEHTYFVQRLYVLHEPRELRTFLMRSMTTREQFEAGTGSEFRDAMKLSTWLLYKAKCHPFDLRAELSQVFRPNGELRIRLDQLTNSSQYAHAVLIQIAVELSLQSEQIRDRMRQDPHFGQLVHDVLYYPSRCRAQGEVILKLSREALANYLNKRSASNAVIHDPANNADPAAAGEVEARKAATANPLMTPDDPDLLLLSEILNGMVEWLSQPELVLKQLALFDTEVLLDTPIVDAGMRSISNTIESTSKELAPIVSSQGISTLSDDERETLRQLGLSEASVERGDVAVWRYDEYGQPFHWFETRHREILQTEGRNRLFEQVQLLRRLDELFREASGEHLSIATLGSHYEVLPATPDWSDLEAAFASVRAYLRAPSDDQNVTVERQVISTYLNAVDTQVNVICRFIQCGLALRRLVHRIAPEPELGLMFDSIARLVNFRAFSSERELFKAVDEAAIVLGLPRQGLEFEKLNVLSASEEEAVGWWKQWYRTTLEAVNAIKPIEAISEIRVDYWEKNWRNRTSSWRVQNNE